MTSALIVVDVQNDFAEGGSLPVKGGLEVARKVFNLLSSPSSHDKYDYRVATKDYHEDPGDHWSRNPDFKDSWPQHCLAGSWGSEFVPPVSHNLFDAVFYKGRWEAAYSGFQGLEARTFVLLRPWLWGRNVTEITVCGLATDYCVKQTALDGVRLGFDVSLLSGLTAGVSDLTTREALLEMSKAGVRLK